MQPFGLLLPSPGMSAVCRRRGHGLLVCAQSAVTDVDSASEATGIAHVLANKGAVCISLKVCLGNTYHCTPVLCTVQECLEL